MEEPAAAATLDYYIDRVERAIEEKSGLETRIKALAEEPRWKPTVDALRCFKGIEVMTAMSLACEVDGFSRFRNASAFSCWLGITPSENSSGERSRRGGQQAPEEEPRRIGMALRQRHTPSEGPRERPGGQPGGQKACAEGKPQAHREKEGLGRCGQEVGGRQHGDSA